MKGVWSLKTADDKYSRYIRERDGRCVMCGRKPPQVMLTCSHYWGRYVTSTRWDDDNCDAVCLGCHFQIENAKQGYYREFKLKQLGTRRYNALQKRYYQEKIKRRDAIIKLMERLK